jgi:type IV pilus assembly protein PilA
MKKNAINKIVQSGFTLLELLVTLSIVGILSAIAIPEYRAYQQRAYDIRALGDLRTVALAEEAYFMGSERYLSCENESCADLPGVSRLSKGVLLSVAADEELFTGTSYHGKGSGKRYRWDSSNGGLQD